MKRLEELGISPAPWELYNVSGAFTKLVYLKDNYEVIRAQDGSEVHFCLHLKDKATSLANARLIAAAPKLYEALQSLVEYIDRECVPCGENACELMMLAHKALAEAAGESEVAK